VSDIETIENSVTVHAADDNKIPLVVDIDGTLINTDLLHETAILLFKKNPLYIFKFLQWIFKGRAYLKTKIFELVWIEYETLPYNQQVLDFLNAEFAKGRKIILATASPLPAAAAIAKVHPIFSDVYGTDNGINLKGSNKLNMLEKQFGKGGFDYIGNSNADLIIFASSRFAYLVNPTGAVKRKAAAIGNLKNTWVSGKATVKDYIKAIRAYQWIKNLLVFVPLITSHTIDDTSLLLLSVYAFALLSITASAGYLLNDVLDVHADRKHPRKRNRAIASGKLSILTAFFMAIVFLATGLIVAANLNINFFFILLSYFIISFSYSVFLKKIVLYDVFILALLYSIRVFAGAIIIDVPLSFWLIAFSTFIFLSLAFVKRCSELMQLNDDGNLQNMRRGYAAADLQLLQVMGVVSGFLAVVVFSLYINSPEVTQLYTQPKILWAISFLFLFWISRIWLHTVRGKMTDDPIVYAIKDVTSYFVFLFTGILIWAAI
jgi:4-hydroxybenzoate polyprenyltransferase/phosphoserine phosphatase